MRKTTVRRHRRRLNLGSTIVRKHLRKIKTFGGGPIFEKYLESQGIHLKGKKAGRRAARRLLEKQPELIEPLTGYTRIGFRKMGISPKGTKSGELTTRGPTLATIRQSKTGKKKMTLPTEFLGGARPIFKKGHKVLISIPKSFSSVEQPLQRIFRHEVGHAKQPLPQSEGPISIEEWQKSPREIEAEAFSRETPERLKEVPEEQVSKTFREMFK